MIIIRFTSVQAPTTTINLKDDLSLLSPPQRIKLYKVKGELGTAPLPFISFFIGVLCLYDYGQSELIRLVT